MTKLYYAAKGILCTQRLIVLREAFNRWGNFLLSALPERRNRLCGVALTNLRYQQDQADDGSEKSTTNTHSRTKNLPRNKLIAEKRKASCPLPEYDSEDKAPIYIPKAPDAALRNLSNQRQRAGGIESISFGENSGERHSQSGNRNNL